MTKQEHRHLRQRRQSYRFHPKGSLLLECASLFFPPWWDTSWWMRWVVIRSRPWTQILLMTSGAASVLKCSMDTDTFPRAPASLAILRKKSISPVKRWQRWWKQMNSVKENRSLPTYFHRFECDLMEFKLYYFKHEWRAKNSLLTDCPVFLQPSETRQWRD